MIKILDGGTLFELNKIHQDVGEFAIFNNSDLIKDIHQQYINIGCQLITTSNYGFKPNRQHNWKELTIESTDILYSLKKSNNFEMLGSLPPYHESYEDGEITEDFCNYYNNIVKIFNNKIDKYIIECCISIDHLVKILEIVRLNNFNKKVIISIYPNNSINQNNLEKFLNDNHDIIDGIIINCCSFNDMIKYFNNTIKKLIITESKNILKDISFGFYCNKIEEQKYKNKDKCVKWKELSSCLNDDLITKEQINLFLENCNSKNIIIGGCCGYGINEMKELIKIINNL